MSESTIIERSAAVSMHDLPWLLANDVRCPESEDNEQIQCFESGYAGKSYSAFKPIHILIDIVAVLASVLLGFLVASRIRSILGLTQVDLTIFQSSEIMWLGVLIPICVVLTLSFAWGHYSRAKTFWAETLDLIKATAYASAVIFAVTFFLDAHPPRLWIMSSLILMVLSVPICRYVCRRFLKSKNLWNRPLIIVGTSNEIRSVEISTNEGQLVSFSIAARIVIHDSVVAERILDLSTPILVELDRLTRVYPESSVLIAFKDQSYLAKLPDLVSFLARNGKPIMVSAPLLGLPQANVEVFSPPSSELVILNLSSRLQSPLSRSLKRAFDVVVSSLLTCILAPLLIGIWLILATQGGKVVYCSNRIGYGGKTFRCFKFRSMRVNADEVLRQHLRENPVAEKEWNTTFKLKNDPRVTRVGSFLRKTSLDELPQLFNVVLGDMSLVGPRPLLPDERESYGGDLEEYTEATPGITGLWQISGRSNTSYQKRIELNRWYQRNWSFWLDIVILLKTLPAILINKDAY